MCNTNTVAPIDRSSLQSRTFSALKWILAIVVVIGHVFGFVETDLTRHYFYISDKLLTAFLRGYSVPVFFLISGYLFCTTVKFEFYTWGLKMKKRFYTRGIPFLVFNVFALILQISELWVRTGNFPVDLLEPANLALCLYNPQTFVPLNEPLWYVMYLMLMFMIAPIMHPLLKWTRGLILIPFFIWFVLGIHTSFFFFYTGYALRLVNLDLVRFSRWLTPWLLPLVFAFSAALLFMNQELYSDSLYLKLKKLNISLTVPVIVTTVSLLVERGLVSCSSQLVASTFFLYLTHEPLLVFLSRSSGDFVNSLSFVPYMVFHVALIIVLTLSACGMYVLLQRRWPRFMSVITGMAAVPKPAPRPQPAMD